MKITRATAADAPEVARIMNDVITNSTATFTNVTKTDTHVAREIEPPNACLILKNGAEVSGYARYFPFRSGPGYAHVAEYSIALTRNACGTGMACDLLNALCDMAKHDGKTQLIGAVSNDNPTAIKFHLNNGFQKVGHLPDVGQKWGKSLDLILMQKQL